MPNRVAVEVNIFVEVFREFVLLLGGQRRFFALIVQGKQFLDAALLIFFEPVANSLLVDEQGGGNVGNTPNRCRAG